MGCRSGCCCEKNCGCYGESDKQIINASTMEELINVMEHKLNRCIKEKKEITDYLNGCKSDLTLVDHGGLSKEDLSKRIPYLDKFSACYEEIIETLRSHPRLPLKETKFFISNIVEHYCISYDETEGYKQDLAKFKQFVSQY